MFKRFKKYSDQEVVTLIKEAKSNNVLRFLYRTVQPKITAWILKNNGNVQEAQDIFQDAVLSFYNHVLDDKFNEGKSVDAFIFKVGKNLWINRVKKRNKQVEEIPVHLVQDESNNVENHDAEEKIASLLAQLGARCEELLTYSIFYKMSMEDIALRMGFSSSDAVKTKNYKCKQRLVLLVKNKKGLKEYLFSE